MEKHSILAVLEHYGGSIYRERNGWQKLKCPFHDDSHASATVNIEENAFNCFGCGIKGDTYKIIMEKEGIEFREAVKVAEGITGQSSSTLRKVHSGGRGVSSKSGNHLSRRAYSPPGIGRRASTRS